METLMQSVIGWTLGEWREAYRNGTITPDIVLTLAAQYAAADNAWIARARPDN